MSKPPKSSAVARPPKPSLASIVAAANADGRAAKPPQRRSAEIVRLDRALAPPAPTPPLKQRAKQMSLYLEQPVYDQLREMAFEERTKMHALLLEAVDLLFRQRGARSIEQVTREERG